jgi:hypothetical protein
VGEGYSSERGIINDSKRVVDIKLAVRQAGWDEMLQIREELAFTKRGS